MQALQLTTYNFKQCVTENVSERIIWLDNWLKKMKYNFARHVAKPNSQHDMFFLFEVLVRFILFPIRLV